MKNYLPLAKETLNFSSVDYPSDLQCLFSLGKISCVREDKLEQVPLRERSFTNGNQERERPKDLRASTIFPMNYGLVGAACTAGIHITKTSSASLKPVFAAIRKQQKKLLSVLHEARITNAINPTVIKEALLVATASGCVTIDMSRTKPQLMFSLENANFLTLEDELEVKLYLHPIFNGYAKKLLNLRTCENCGEFFFYTREEAKFCSAQCQGIAGRRRRNEK